MKIACIRITWGGDLNSISTCCFLVPGRFHCKFALCIKIWSGRFHCQCTFCINIWSGRFHQKFTLCIKIWSGRFHCQCTLCINIWSGRFHHKFTLCMNISSGIGFMWYRLPQAMCLLHKPVPMAPVSLGLLTGRSSISLDSGPPKMLCKFTY